ncbi:MAG: AtpZ/AtpI family protein [Acidimicrobiales bacterium]|jgi:hypothetical protein
MRSIGLPRQKHSDVGDGLSKAFEIVVTPVLFGLLGFGLDRWLGSTPWLTAIFATVALAGKFAAEWFRYESKMDELQDERTEGRSTEAHLVSLQVEDIRATLPTGVSLDSSQSAVDEVSVGSSSE